MNRIEKMTTSEDLLQILDDLEHIHTAPETIDDLPPEYCTYRDEGCELAPACLECPLPQCVLDQQAINVNRSQRDQEIRRLHAESKFSVPLIAERFGITERTVWRVLRAKI